jgi:hypothetical protein
MFQISKGYWRKECSSCHSTGPFVLQGRPRPDYDPRIDYPERYREGPI